MITLQNIQDHLQDNKLDLSDLNIKDENVSLIWEFIASHPEIEEIDLSNNRLSDVGVQRLCNKITHSPLNKNLKNLDITKNKINSPNTIDSLSNTNFKVDLEENNGWNFHPKNSEAYLQTKITQRDDLDLSRVAPIIPEYIEEIARFISKHEEIKSLNLSKTELNNEAAAKLYQFLEENTSITSIDLSENNITDPKLIKNFTSLKGKKINLKENMGWHLSPDGLACNYLNLHKANTLWLSHPSFFEKINIDHIESVKEFLLAHPEITTVDLSYCDLTDEEHRQFAKTLSACASLKMIKLSDNQSIDAAALMKYRKLTLALNQPKANKEYLTHILKDKKLDLSFSQINDDHIKAICDFITEHNQDIEEIDLSGNEITDVGAIELSVFLHYLKRNKVNTEDDFQLIENAYSTNDESSGEKEIELQIVETVIPTIKKLDISNNQIDVYGLKALADMDLQTVAVLDAAGNRGMFSFETSQEWFISFMELVGLHPKGGQCGGVSYYLAPILTKTSSHRDVIRFNIQVRELHEIYRQIGITVLNEIQNNEDVVIVDEIKQDLISVLNVSPQSLARGKFYENEFYSTEFLPRFKKALRAWYESLDRPIEGEYEEAAIEKVNSNRDRTHLLLPNNKKSDPEQPDLIGRNGSYSFLPSIAKHQSLQSISLEEKENQSIFYLKSVNNIKELEERLRLIRDEALGQQLFFSIFLEADVHATLISFDPQLGKWTYTNANKFFIKSYSDVNALAKDVFKSHAIEINKGKTDYPISLVVFVEKENKIKAENIFSPWLKPQPTLSFLQANRKTILAGFLISMTCVVVVTAIIAATGGFGSIPLIATGFGMIGGIVAAGALGISLTAIGIKLKEKLFSQPTFGPVLIQNNSSPRREIFSTAKSQKKLRGSESQQRPEMQTDDFELVDFKKTSQTLCKLSLSNSSHTIFAGNSKLISQTYQNDNNHSGKNVRKI